MTVTEKPATHGDVKLINACIESAWKENKYTIAKMPFTEMARMDEHAFDVAIRVILSERKRLVEIIEKRKKEQHPQVGGCLRCREDDYFLSLLRDVEVEK